MAATAAIIGKGSTLTTSATSGGSYVAIAEVVDVDHPRIKVSMIDATNFDSPTSTVEKISGTWQEPDDIKVSVHYLKAQTTTILALVGVNRFYKITLPDTSTWLIPGVMSDFGGAKIAPKEMIAQDFTITPTGPLTWTAGS